MTKRRKLKDDIQAVRPGMAAPDADAGEFVAVYEVQILVKAADADEAHQRCASAFQHAMTRKTFRRLGAIDLRIRLHAMVPKESADSPIIQPDLRLVGADGKTPLGN